MSTSNFDLDKRARDLWAAWLQAALERRGSSQKAIAIEIDQQDGSSARSDVSRFVTGKEGTLRAWFTVHLDRVNLLARHTGLSVDELRAKLVALQRGELEPEVAWHPAFPELRLADVEIPAVLEGERGESLERVIEQMVTRLGDPKQWSSSAKHEKLGLVGPAGQRRDSAARQVHALLQARLDAVRAEAVAKLSTVQPKDRRGQPRKTEEIPAIRVEVAVAPAPVEPAPGVVRLLVIDEEQAHKTENLSYLRLTLGRWGAAQAVALARRLAALLPAGPSSALRSFADRAETTPAMVGEEASPDLVIRLLAEVSRRGCPPSVPAARDLLARAAWEQAQVRAGDALEPFDERLMDHLMAALAVRPRTRPDDVRTWTWAPRAVVMETLRAAMASLLGPAAGRPLASLVAEAKQAKGAARQAAFEALELTLASEPAADVVDALICGGVLVEEQRYTGVFLRIVEPTVAAIWAARGLSELPPFDPNWLRLLDPDWLFVLDELGRRGLRMEALRARLEGAPAELRIDAAAWMIRLTLASPELVPTADLVPYWGTLVWAEAHGMFTSMVAWSEGPWGAWVKRGLREISRRYRDELPVFELDPVEELAQRIPEPARALVATWRRTPLPGVEPGEWLRQWGLHAWGELRSRDDLRHFLCDLCPDQVIPTQPWSIDWWYGRDLARGIMRLAERAKRGDDRALRLLDGRAWLEAREDRMSIDLDMSRRGVPAPVVDQLWHHIPASALVTWVAPAGHSGPDATRLLQDLARRMKPEEQDAGRRDLLRLASCADAAEVEELCARSLIGDQRWYRPFDAKLALALAEHLGLKALLREIVDRPGRLLPESRLHVRDGRVVIEPTDEWTPMVAVVVEGEPHQPHGVRIELDELIDTMEEHAHAAAVSLYRLGERAALRARWTTGPTYLTGLPLWRDLARAEGLYALVACGFPSPLFEVEALLRLGGVEGEDQEADPFTPMQHKTEHGVYPARPVLLDDLKRMANILRPELQAIGRGARILLQHLPDELSAEIEHILLGGPTGRHRHRPGNLPFRIQGWQRRAATALLELGDDEPLRMWARVGSGRLAGTELVQQTAYVVEQWLNADRTCLDRAWSMVQAEARAGQLTAESRSSAEDRLLHDGSARSWPDPLESNTLRNVDPRSYVLATALRTDDLGRWTVLHHLNRHHRDWVPVIRQRLQRPPDERTRAALALDLSQHVSNPPELGRAIRFWALEDPAPFLGGPRVDWRAGHAVGGFEPLLAGLVALDQPWVRDALVRLWRLALRLPIRGDRPRYETWTWAEDRPAEPMVLVPSGFGSCPSPLVELARHLETRGLAEEILSAWETPPLEPAPELEDERDRTWWIRAWLRPWWLSLADNAALLRDLYRDPVRFPMDVVDELIRRRAPEIEDFAAHLARVTDHFLVRPLLETDPGAAVGVVAERTGQPIAPVRMELASALEDAGSRWFRHLGVLRLLRTRVGEIAQEDEPLTGGQGLRDT